MNSKSRQQKVNQTLVAILSFSIATTNVYAQDESNAEGNSAKEEGNRNVMLPVLTDLEKSKSDFHRPM